MLDMPNMHSRYPLMHDLVRPPEEAGFEVNVCENEWQLAQTLFFQGNSRM
jgi:hypothetical protein